MKRFLIDCGVTDLKHSISAYNNTQLEMTVEHMNDCIEAGPCVKDEEGKLFFVVTHTSINFEIPAENYDSVIQALSNLDTGDYDKSKYADFDNLICDMSPSRSAIKVAPVFNSSKLEITLRFKIYHMC
jgi:hypothetical protein